MGFKRDARWANASLSSFSAIKTVNVSEDRLFEIGG
jgi:hypothetical protein